MVELNEEMLKKMIGDYEEIVKNASSKLNELKSIAQTSGIMLPDEQGIKNVLPSQVSPMRASIAAEMEKNKKEIMEKVQKAKEEAQLEAKKAMDHAMNSVNLATSQIKNMPIGMNVTPSVPRAIDEVAKEPAAKTGDPNVNLETMFKAMMESKKENKQE